jgi:hypothetical protein
MKVGQFFMSPPGQIRMSLDTSDPALPSFYHLIPPFQIRCFPSVDRLRARNDRLIGAHSTSCYPRQTTWQCPSINPCMVISITTFFAAAPCSPWGKGIARLPGREAALARMSVCVSVRLVTKVSECKWQRSMRCLLPEQTTQGCPVSWLASVASLF